MEIKLQKPTQEQIDAYKNRPRPKKVVAAQANPTSPVVPVVPPLDVIKSPRGIDIKRSDFYAIINEATACAPQRWPEAEELLLVGHLYYAAQYAQQVIKGEWPELEAKFLENTTVDSALSNYCYYIKKGRWPELEAAFLQQCEKNGTIPGNAVYFCSSVVKARWIELEELIVKFGDANTASHYCGQIMKMRWPEMEPAMLKKCDAYSLKTYAINNMRGRWREAEPRILANNYARDQYIRDLQRMEIAPPPMAIRECDNAILGILSLKTGDYAEIYDPTDPDIVILFGEGRKPYVTDGTNIYDLKGTFIKPCNAACTMKINRYIGATKSPEEKK